MTEQERYNVILQELAEAISAKNSEINLLRWRVIDLEAKLKEAEEARNNESERVGA